MRKAGLTRRNLLTAGAVLGVAAPALRAKAAAPVSRIMVRQPQSKANAGAFNNGMPMTSSMGCGIWGGNITNENISLKHYMNVTWVSRPIAEDRPSEQELFGEFYNSSAFDEEEAAQAIGRQ